MPRLVYDLFFGTATPRSRWMGHRASPMFVKAWPNTRAVELHRPGDSSGTRPVDADSGADLRRHPLSPSSFSRRGASVCNGWQHCPEGGDQTATRLSDRSARIRTVGTGSQDERGSSWPSAAMPGSRRHARSVEPKCRVDSLLSALVLVYRAGRSPEATARRVVLPAPRGTRASTGKGSQCPPAPAGSASCRVRPGRSTGMRSPRLRWRSSGLLARS